MPVCLLRMKNNAPSPVTEKPAASAAPPLQHGQNTWVIASDWRKRLALFFMILLVSVALDQGSKKWVQSNLARATLASQLPQMDSKEAKSDIVYVPTRRIKVVSGVFDLLYVENSAAAFSLTESLPLWLRIPLLIAVSLIAIAAFLFWYFTLQQATWASLTSFCLVISGAVGNLIDRATLGYVIDFFHLHAEFVGHPHVYWPTFNVADSLICIGAASLLLHTIKEEWSKPSPETSSVS